MLSAAAHLRTCVDCQHELVSHVVAHASLTSAQRFAPEIVHRVAADNFAPQDGDDQHHAELPDLSAVFAQVRQEASEGFRPERERPNRRPYLVAVAAAAVAAVATGGIVYAATGTDAKSSGRTIALSAFDKGRSAGSATIGDGTIELNATALPTLTGKRYEVWLTNAQRTRMQPIGWIGNDGHARLTVPTEMMAQYADLEVSVQRTSADNYTYSGESVLRGSI